MSNRGQLRMIVAVLVIMVIAASLILETPGTVETVGLAVVAAAMLLIIVQERGKLR